MAIVACAVPVHADILSPAVGLEELAQQVDLVCKATVVADRVVTDEWFPPIGGYEARETELRIVSVIQGTASHVIRFRHYTSVPTPRVTARQSHALVHGRTYLVFARRAHLGCALLARRNRQRDDPGVVPARTKRACGRRCRRKGAV